MKKTYSKSFRQGLPGGPNEMFEKVKGIIVSERGQWDFPGMNTLVPTDDGRITMRGVPYPVYGQDETGYGQMMYPGQEYQFPGNNVLELPMAQVGLQVPVQKPDALRVQMNINPNAEYMEKKKSDVLDLDNTLDYLVETRGGTRDLWGRMADTIGYHESAHTMDPLQMQNSGGPGRGIFQFEAPSLVTAQNRYKRIASKLNLKTDPEILNAKSALELSPEQQYSLFLINLSESKAKLKDYADNKLPLVDLWLQGHKNKEAEGDRGSFRTSVQKAKDKSIQKGYDSFKQLGGSLPRFQNGNQVPAQSEPEPEPFTLPKGKDYYFKEDGETNLPKKMESIEKRNLRFYDFETEEDYVNFLTSEKSKNKDFGCKEDNCAEFANNRAGELVGLSGADLSTWLRGGKYKIGVGGNAWQTYGNILDLGGKSIFNNYKNQGDVSQVKPGDIIGLKKWSVYNHSGRYSIRGENAPKAGVDNSHQGVVEYVDKKGNIYIRHNIHGSTSVKKLTAKNNEYYLGDTGWKIVTAARPNFEKYQHADIDYKPEIGQYYVKPFISDYNPNEEIIFKQDVVKQADPHRYKTRHGNFMAGEAAQKKDWLTGQLNIQGIPVTERAGNEDMQKFVNSLNDNKEKLMHYYHLKNDEFNEIAKHALATAGAESDFGTSSKLKIKESSPALARLIKNARDREIYDSDEMSRGIGQVKPYSLDDIFKQMFGVTERNINKPEYNALAVFSHLADDIRKVKNWSKKNTDLPEEVRNNYPFLATAAYVNPYTVAAGNLSYDPSFQNDPNKPYEPIGLDNKRLRIISDYIKDVGILNTKNPFAGQKLKEFRVVPEQQLGGSLPRFQGVAKSQVPTYSDSLELYQNTVALENFLRSKNAYLPNYRFTQWKWKESHPRVGGSRVSNWYDLNSRLSNRDQALDYLNKLYDEDISASQKSLPRNHYIKRKNNLIGSRDWAISGYDDKNLPVSYIHPQIKPQFEGDTSIPGEGMFYMYRYDPVAIKPGALLTPKELALRLKKYGKRGIPQSKIDEYYASKNPVTPIVTPPADIIDINKSNQQTPRKEFVRNISQSPVQLDPNQYEDRVRLITPLHEYMMNLDQYSKLLPTDSIPQEGNFLYKLNRQQLGGSLPTAGDPVLNFIQSQSPRFSKSKK